MMYGFRVFGRACIGGLPTKSLAMKEPLLALRVTAGGVPARVLPGNWLSAHSVDPVRLSDPSDLDPCVGLRARQASALDGRDREPRACKEVRVDTPVDTTVWPNIAIGDLNLPKGDANADADGDADGWLPNFKASALKVA